jgi:tetratricopeptide (TPR) repeat protein
MDLLLPSVYLSVLLGLLALAGIAIVRQVFKTRTVESQLSKLQGKLTKEKGNPAEYYELGTIYLDKKLFGQALNLFQRALKAGEIEPDRESMIYNGIGFAHFAQEQYDLAIRNYKEALKLNPEYVVALNNLGHAYERKQLTSQALEVYEQALKNDPKNQTAKRRSEALRKRVTTKVA